MLNIGTQLIPPLLFSRHVLKQIRTDRKHFCRLLIRYCSSKPPWECWDECSRTMIPAAYLISAWAQSNNVFTTQLLTCNYQVLISHSKALLPQLKLIKVLPNKKLINENICTMCFPNNSLLQPNKNAKWRGKKCELSVGFGPDIKKLFCLGKTFKAHR